MDHDLIVETALQIIDSSVDHEAMFHEACSLSKKIKLHNETSESACLEASAVEGFLSVTCQDHQRNLRSGRRDLHPIPSLAQQVIDLSKSGCLEEGPLLNHEVKKKFESILAHLKSKTEDFWYSSRLFESLVMKHNLPLEVVWNLQMIGALSLDAYIICKIHEDPIFVEKFSQELVLLCQGSVDSFAERQQVLSGFAEYLIKKGYGEDKSTLTRSAMHLFASILKGVLDLQVPTGETEHLALPTDFLSFQESIPKEVLRRFSSHSLSCILSIKADSSVSEILKSNTVWSSVPSHETARALYRQLFLPLTCEEVAGILLQSLDQLKVSGVLTFTFLKAMHSSFKEAANIMNRHIKARLSDGLDNSDTAKLSAAFILVRQSAAIGCDGFLGYSEWFQSTFGESGRSLAATRPTFTCLIKFLSHLVPSESAQYLRVHIMKRPTIPSKCRDFFEDYIALAKTRLDDLKVPLHDLCNGLYENPGPNGDGCNRKVNQAEEDVERTVGAFAETGRIPTALIEASIFRKPYFIRKFLPALLTPRHLPEEPDLRMKLIAEVYNSRKISPQMYNNYLDECEKEKQAFLERQSSTSAAPSEA